MKTHKKRGLVVVILVIMSFIIQAYNNVDKEVPQNTESAAIKDEKDDTDEVKNETSFDCSKTMIENIDVLNSMLEAKYGNCLSLFTKEDYEKTGQSDWILILSEDKVAIDTATWKYGYDPDSDEGRYMDAILTTFIFFYEEEMGNSLWLLTGDLIDGGADESLYGFTHDGGNAIYKNGDTATYELGNNDNFYIWLTPNGLGL